ncbi:MAG: NAD-dependent epimerase/dehydratase family protein [Pseudomonadota bacterium]|nr:NAD-dependent epimerase/dehydratase family protein [Pseudomonadota bacterium]
MESAIVSGISGHLGHEVARQLLLSGVRTIGLTRRPVEHLGMAGVDWHRIDGRTETLLEVFQQTRPDTVLHLAGLSRREHVSGDVSAFVEANILLGAQLLEAMRVVGGRRFITAGTYLQHASDGTPRPFNLYAATKLAFEDIAAYYAEAYGIAVARLTLSDIYSEHDTRPKLMTDLANAWATGAAVVVRDAGARVDLIHLEDAAAAFLDAASWLEQGHVSGALACYSVSSGADISALELVSLFESIGGRGLRAEVGTGKPSPRSVKPWRGAAVPGWAPRINLEQGIARIIAARK